MALRLVVGEGVLDAKCKAATDEMRVQLAANVLLAPIIVWPNEHVAALVSLPTPEFEVTQAMLPMPQMWWTYQDSPTISDPDGLLATNGGLSPGSGEAGELKRASAATDASLRRTLAARHCGRLEADEEQVGRFFEALSIDDDLPGRQDVAASQTTYLLRPVLRQLRLDELRAEEAYEGIVDLVVTASRQTYGSRLAMFAYVNDPSRLRIDAATDELLRRRIILLEDVLARVRQAVAVGATELVPHGDHTTETTLVAKLNAGGLGPTTVASAQRLRAIWSELEARFPADLPDGDDDFEDLRTRVQAIAADAESSAQAVTPTGSSYGPACMLR